MDFNNLQVQAEAYVHTFFSTHPDPRFVYHNLQHTESVVDAATQIANHFQLNEQDFCIVLTAAWFHDLGYLIDYRNHEAESAQLARAFLKDRGAAEPIIDAVSGCILATKLPQTPHSLLEQIVCDADLFHLGSTEFRERNKLMRKEAEVLKEKPIDKQKWRESTIMFLESHHYHTDYGRLLLNDGKSRNLQKLQEKMNDKGAEVKILGAATSADKEASGKSRKNDGSKTRPDRGIETMFRITSTNNQRLSDMADNKAQIMITVNSIILSVVISLLLRKLDSNEHLAIPTYMLLAVGVLTIIFSILATRPSLPPGTFTPQDIENKKVNLLFFGNFYKMNLEEYTNGMLKVMEDRDFLYGSLIKDVYSQGIVLGRKYRLLRISYNIFMYGLIASVIAFVVATIS